jgi:APA family basic amino acid/polyamine antiporter
MQPYTALATTDEGAATLATAFAAVGVDWAAAVISIGALAGLTTVVMVLLLGQTRVLLAMSRDGLIPRGLSATGSRGTPVRITVGVGVLVAVVAATVDFGTLAELVNVGTLFAFVLVSIGIIVLRRTRPELPRAFRVPLVPWLPIAAVLACLWLMLNLTAFTWLRFLGWMVLGLAVYVAYGARKSRLRARHPSAADEQVR